MHIVKTKVVNTGRKGEIYAQFIGSRKESGQKSVWEDLHFLLPRSFIQELVRFRRDNSLAVTYSMHGPKIECCEKCLKAHAIKTAIRMGFDRHALSKVEKMFPGETGHVGYYMDKTKLIEL